MDIATWIQITMQYCNVRILTVIKMVDNNLGGGGEMGGGGGGGLLLCFPYTWKTLFFK